MGRRAPGQPADGAPHWGDAVVGLLRGVNLGPSRKLRMADLRSAVESLGHTDVETYLQSGNVVFTPADGRRGPDLGCRASPPALAEAVGHRRQRPDQDRRPRWRKIVAANPYEREDPTKVVVTFLERAADAGAGHGAATSPTFAPEGLTVTGHRDLPRPPGRPGPLHAARRPRQAEGLRHGRHQPQLAHRRRPAAAMTCRCGPASDPCSHGARTRGARQVREPSRQATDRFGPRPREHADQVERSPVAGPASPSGTRRPSGVSARASITAGSTPW